MPWLCYIRNKFHLLMAKRHLKWRFHDRWPFHYWAQVEDGWSNFTYLLTLRVRLTCTLKFPSEPIVLRKFLPWTANILSLLFLPTLPDKNKKWTLFAYSYIPDHGIHVEPRICTLLSHYWDIYVYIKPYKYQATSQRISFI